jgi:predicted chitinase
MPHANKLLIKKYIVPINKTLAEFEINTPTRIAAFLAQLAHESGSLRYSEEIATGKAYEGRGDLGNINPGDGVKYKGRGLIQLTGRFNYTKYGNQLGVDLINNPQLAAEPELAVRIAGAYWHNTGLNTLSDRGNFREITRRINGGFNGLTDRIKYWEIAKRVLNSVNLAIPYFSQRDNKRDPHQTCNVTCIAMCLAFYGVKASKSSIQLEDELDAVVSSKGWDRYLHSDLVKLSSEYGVKSIFSTTTPWQEIKEHLKGGNPVIMSGKFTNGGHIIVLRGYDNKGFFVNDPYGDHQPGGGYKATSGENLHYSYNKMYHVSYGGSRHTWAHLMSKQ